MSTVTAGSVTLAQTALTTNEPLVKMVTDSLIDNGSVLVDCPFITTNQLTVPGVRWEGNLPTVNWRPINEVPTPVSGEPTPFSEQAFSTTDTLLIATKLVDQAGNIVNPRDAQIQAYLKAHTYKINDYFINNDHLTDAHGVVGLKARIDNGTKYGVFSENKIDGSDLDLSENGASVLDANKLFSRLNQLLWSVDAPAGSPSVNLFCNWELQDRISYLARVMGTQGGFSTTTDAFGRQVTTYRGCPIRDVGRKADQDTQIITNTETSAGAAGSSTYTSIYAVNFSPMHFMGWQWGDPMVKDLGIVPPGIQYQTLFDWTAGFINYNIHSIGRIYGLKMS